MLSVVQTVAKSPKGPGAYLILMAAASGFSFAVWNALLNNFSVEYAGFTGREIGILQSLREVPGFLAFTAVFVMLILKEQTFAVLSVALLGLGVASAGFFPSEYGLYFTTIIMSVGFHYAETLQMSLSLQWFSKNEAPKALGHQVSARSLASIVAYIALWLLLELAGFSYASLFALAGLVTVAAAIYSWRHFPSFETNGPQQKKLVLRKSYWLFYALTFMGGARRQIFVVFAGFLLVTKFGFSAAEISALYLANQIMTALVAPKLGGLIARFGERPTLIFEYVGLIIVFLGYAYTSNAAIAATFYVLDHLFFAFAIAHKSYLKKIADPKDIAATSSVSFSINHIAAVIIPWVFGAFLWPVSPALVFVAGAIMAAISLILSLNVPKEPAPTNEVIVGYRSANVPAE